MNRIVQDFKRLKVWDKAYRAALEVHRLTRSFPPEERFGLVSQIRRSAASVAANIAEGCGRLSRPELARFLRVALGSAAELECHLMMSKDLSFLDPADYASISSAVEEVRRMIVGLLKSMDAFR